MANNYPIKMLRDEDGQPFVPFSYADSIADSDGNTLQDLMDSGKYQVQNNVTTASPGNGVLDAYQGKVLNDKFNNYILKTEKGVANGVATLGGDGKVPSGQLPSFVDDVIECYTRNGATPLSANWLSLTNGGAALTPETGKIYVVMSTGAYQNKQYRWGGTTYVLCNPSDVNSVNGFTGVVVLKSLKIQKNGTQVGSSFNGTTDTTIDLSIPTKTSDITNDSGFITADDDINGNAATATKATNDRLGRQIDTTYVTLAGNETISGKKDFSTAEGLNYSGIAVGSANKSYNLWFSDPDKKGIPVYNTNLSFNPNTNTLSATTFSGALSGNATSATTATNDSAGNNISTTYLKKGGDTMTGSLQYNDTTGSTFIKIGSNNKDTNLMRVYSSDQTYKETGAYGFSLKYLGTGSGNANKLVLYSDNGTAATQVEAFNVAQDGVITVGKTIVGTINRAIGDEDGNNIKSTYSTKANTIRGLSVSGRVITYTKDDGTTGTITTQDTIYTLPTATSTRLGGIKVGNRLQVTDDGVLSVLNGGTADNVDWSGVLNKPTNVSYWTNDAAYITLGNVMAGASSSADGARGVVPKPVAGDQNKYLRGDGQWAGVDYAATAGSATTATNATNATNATHATSADTATTATSATTAASATKATQDSDGNAINTTYLKKSGGTMTGALNFNNNLPLTWTGGTYQQKIAVTDDSTANTAVFEFQQSTDSGSTWPTLMTIKDNGEVVATKFTGALNGNANTATNLATARKINGTNFDGSADITTANWGTSRNIGIVNSDGTGTAVTVAVNGSQAVNLKLPAAIKANVTGSLTGNADTATKATGDKNGLDITNYIKGLSVSGRTITYTKGDNTTGTITTQDTIYTLPVAGTSSTGTLGGIRVGSGLSIDSTTGVLSATGGGTADSVEWSGVLNKPTKVSYWTNDAGYTTNTGTITGVSVNGTSVATSGVANITSVPASILTGAIPSAVTAVTQTAGDSSTKIATTAFVQNAISGASGAMVFKGTIGTNGSAGTALPTTGVRIGDTYKIITAGTYASQAAKAGDLFIATATTPTWAYVPSGDEGNGTVTSVTIKATGPIAIDSSSAITTSGTRTISHSNSGVTAGTYRSVTVNATGHVTAGTNPTTLSGYGITDAKIANGVITLGSNTITPLTASSTLDATKLSGTIPASCYTDTKYAAGTGLSLSGTTINHSNSVTAGTAGTSSATSGSTVAVPYVTYDAQGHVTASGTHTHTITGFSTTDTKNTAGSTDTSSKIFLIGATSQAANPQTYSDNEVYVTSGVLTTKSVQVGGTAATMQYNSTDKCIEFVFA